MAEKADDLDFCILGAGIAGLSLADALNEHGYSVIVLEQRDIASGASGTPGALVNPATGRRATKTWKAESCYRAIRDTLRKVQAFADSADAFAGQPPFYRNNGLLRPAVTEKMERKMREQYQKTSWPDGWVHWIDEKEVKERHPGITCTGGGLWLPIGLTVNAGAYLQAYAAWLQTRGVIIQTRHRQHIMRDGDRILLHDRREERYCQHLVHATGYSLLYHGHWKYLPLEAVKGQVGRYRADPDLLNFSHSISSLGYLARLDDGNTFIQGSTYDHDFENLSPTYPGERYLRQRMARTLPDLAEQAELVDEWAGARITTPDKKPVLGRHPEIPNLHIFSGLGSKGLMYGRFLAGHYADHLRNGTPLLDKVDVSRYTPEE